jgi:hypothetical protein
MMVTCDFASAGMDIYDIPRKDMASAMRRVAALLEEHPEGKVLATYNGSWSYELVMETKVTTKL